MPGKIQYHKDKENRKDANTWCFVPKIDRRGGVRENAGRRRKDKLIYKGKEYHFSELAKLATVKKLVLKDRIDRKWPLEKAMHEPVAKKHQLMGYKDAVEMYQYTMRRFLTKHQRLASYKRLVTEMKEQRMKKAA